MKKRGQITVFILLGALLVVGGAIYLYANSQQYTSPTIPKDKDAKVVYTYVTDCVQQIGRHALTAAALNGGHITIPDHIARNPTSYLAFGDAVKIPLWYYDGKDRTPSLDEIQSHMDRYINENLPVCLNEFAPLQDRYQITVLNESHVHTTIGPQHVTVHLTLPLRIETIDKTVTLTEYTYDFDVKFGTLHSMATQLMQFENEHAWFENITMEFVSMHPDIPLNGIDVSCSEHRWPLSDITTDLQQALQANLPYVRIKGTDTPPFEQRDSVYKKIMKDYAFEDIVAGRYPKDAPRDMYAYAHMQLDLGFPESDIRIRVEYDPSWGMDLSAFPHDNGVLSSRKVKGAQKYLSYLCINMHHFTYDIIYPVRVTLIDPDAFNGEGFTYQFAFPIIINDNTADRQSFGYHSFEGFNIAPDFCTSRGTEEVTIRVEGDYGQFGTVELDDVSLVAHCLTKACPLGSTHAESGRYQLTTTLPEGCANPFIEASKEGYLTQTAQVGRGVLTMNLPRLRPLELQIEKIPYDAETQTFYPPRPLRRGENVTVLVEYLGDVAFAQAVHYPHDTHIELIDDDAAYSIHAVLTLFDDFVGGYTNDNLTVTYEDIQGTRVMKLQVFESVPPIQSEAYAKDTTMLLLDATTQSELEVSFK